MLPQRATRYFDPAALGFGRLAARRLRAERNAVEYRGLARTRRILDVARERGTGGLGFARKRQLDELLVVSAQPPPRDRPPQHRPMAIALPLIVQRACEAQQPARWTAGNQRHVKVPVRLLPARDRFGRRLG